jgi:hypothetical protein
MKFQICTCGKHLFIHGNFFDENGPYLEGMGMERLSRDIFSQADARTFIQQTLDSGKITLGEACELVRDQVLFLLPEENPSSLAMYQKNERAQALRVVTPEGKRQLATFVLPKYSFKRFLKWLLPSAVFKAFCDKKYLLFPQKTRIAFRRQTQKRTQKMPKKLKQEKK